jgi:hypothetical protein
LAGTLAARMVLTVAGAAGMIIGAFLKWLSEAEQIGTEIEVQILWSYEIEGQANFVSSVGFVAIILGLLALVGLAFRTGWLTRVAGALGIVVFVLYVITIYRVPEAEADVSNVGLGAWLVLIGGVLALIGGFLGTRTVVAQRATAPPPPAA